ncbi:hypothetical protein HSB1_20850 [Halogranum salarium B-1]|uniref:Uncharacterized protein n=1 Tax=Halogranum salarium B-1 TaxID=1210908 RepID=J3EXP2_9EURY|nr:hypothetical protein HSB1_20850 [Halogranum salarium B-1]
MCLGRAKGNSFQRSNDEASGTSTTLHRRTSSPLPDNFASDEHFSG